MWVESEVWVESERCGWSLRGWVESERCGWSLRGEGRCGWRTKTYCICYGIDTMFLLI